MTQAGASETDKWVVEKGAKYAYAYDKTGKLGSYFGVRGIPDAVLLDASGKVVWRGHPGDLQESTIQSALTGALPKPLWEWSPATKGVKNALLKRSYKSALDQAAKLGAADGGPELVASIQGIVTSSVQGMKATFEMGDFLGAQTAAQRMQKDMLGLPEVDEAAKVLASITADKNAQNVIKGQQKLAKIRDGENTKRKEIEGAMESVRKIRKEYPGTYVEKDADALMGMLGDALKALEVK